MADQFDGSGNQYPQGSFYGDLANRITALEAVLGTAPGTVPDGSITTYKLSDSAVTGPKIAANALPHVIDRQIDVAAPADTAALAGSDGGSGFKLTLANLVTKLFNGSRKIANGWFTGSSLRIWNAAGTFYHSIVQTVTANRTITLPDANVDLTAINQIMGLAQTWQDVTASRAVTTVYQNTTGRPIAVNVSGGGTSSGLSSLDTSPDNITWTKVGYGVFDTSGAHRMGASFIIVPPGHYYRMTTVASGTISTWLELR